MLTKIIFVIHVSFCCCLFVISCSALPLPLQSEVESSSTTTTTTTTEQPVEMKKPIVYSHDNNPFDSSSFSFKFGNTNISQPNPNSIDMIPIVQHHHVLPLEDSHNSRQQRLHVFRPLFVYRQEQAMRRRATARPSFDPDRFYHPYYPYHYHHQYASNYPDFYDSYPSKSYDYLSNDLSHDKLPAYDFWYP